MRVYTCVQFLGHPFTDVSCDEISIIEIGHCCERDKGSERRIDRATRRTDQPLPDTKHFCPRRALAQRSRRSVDLHTGEDFQGSCPATPHPQTRPH